MDKLQSLHFGAFHKRNPTLDCSPLAKSATAFATGSWTDCGVQEAADPHASAGECIPAVHAAPLPVPAHAVQQPAQPVADARQMPPVAPAGSAWNWGEQNGPADLPVPAPRIVAHKPSPSWFSPLMGFGGPSRVQWEEEQWQAEVSWQQQQQQLQRGRQQAPVQLRDGTPVSQQQQHPAARATQPSLQQQGSQHVSAASAPLTPPEAAAQFYGQPLAREVSKLQQLQQAQGQQRYAAERSLPWHQQGWRQQPAQPMLAPVQQQPPAHAWPSSSVHGGSAGHTAAVATAPGHPSGNPFADEAFTAETARAAGHTSQRAQRSCTNTPSPPEAPTAASASAPPVLAPLGRTSPGVGRPAAKLPPPPRFLLARGGRQQQAQQAQQAQHPANQPSQPGQHRHSLPAEQLPHHQPHRQQRSLPQDNALSALAPCGSQDARDVRSQGSPSAEPAAMVNPPLHHAVTNTSSSGHGSKAGMKQQPGGQTEGPASNQHQLQAPQQVTPAPPPPPPPPPPLSAKTATHPPPPPPLPPKPACRVGQAAALGGAVRSARVAAPPPPPLPPGGPNSVAEAATAAAVWMGRRAACIQPATESSVQSAAQGHSSLSDIKPAELAAAARRLRRVVPSASSSGSQPGTGAGASAAAAGAAGVMHTAQGSPTNSDARAQLMAAIRGGQFRLRKASERQLRHAAAPAGGASPLGPCSGGMAELLRRVVERRRVVGGDSSDSDSEWER